MDRNKISEVIETSNDLTGSIEKLQSLGDTINEICRVSGVAAVSLGVFHGGQVIHRANFGLRDVINGSLPDGDTIYPIASLTKGMTAAAFGHLVHKNIIKYNSPIRDVYPEFVQVNKEVQTQATIGDLLAHKTGLVSKNCYWHQARQRLLLPKVQTARTVSILESCGKLSDSFIYNNWTYAFAGMVLESLTSTSFESFVRKVLFSPLGLKRTMIGVPSLADFANVARTYTSYDHGQACEVPYPEISDDTIMGPAVGA